MWKIIASFLCFIIIFNSYADNNYLAGGIKLFKAGNYPESIVSFRESLKHETPPSLIHYYLGTSLYRQKEYKDAAVHLEKYLEDGELDDFNPFRESVANLFRIYRQEKNWEKTVQKGKLLLARIEGNKKFDRLKPAINNAVSSALISMGHGLFRDKNYREAKSLFQEALAFNPKNTAAMERIGRANYFLGYKKEAEKNFIDFLESGNRNWRNISMSAYHLRLMKTDILPLAERTREINPLASEILKVYDSLFEGSMEKSFQMLKKIEDEEKTGGEITRDIIGKVQGETDSPEELYLLFIKYYPASRHGEWMSRRILTLARGKENSEETRNELGKVLKKIIEEGLPRDRLPEFERLVVDIAFDSGEEETVEMLRGKLAGYSKIAEKYPESSTAKAVSFEMAMIYADKLSEDDMAIDILSSLAKDGNYKNSAVELARIHVRKKDYEKSAELLQKILLEHPENDSAKMMLGETLLLLGEYDRGIKILQELESETRKKNIKNSIANLLMGYRKTEDEKNGKTGDFINVRVTRSETYFSTSANMDKSSPALAQKSVNVDIHPFSPVKKKLGFILGMTSEDKPSITEPYTLYTVKNGKNYQVKWRSEAVSSPDRWRPERPFKIVYPWREEIPENVEITRKSRVEGDELIAEIEISTPSEGWDIKIIDLSLRRKKDGASPVPDSDAGAFISYLLDKAENLKVSVTYKCRPEIISYYPEVVVSRKEKSGSNPIEAIPSSNLDGIFMQTEGGNFEIFLWEEREKIFRLSEQMERR